MQVLRLLELIERMNRAVERCAAMHEPDEFSIRQYSRLRDDYTRERLEVLRTNYGLVLQPIAHPKQAA